ncbi:putative membrane protein [Luteitalea pratensis]|uniref:Putative membrane protein n=1 Tax=Luteitalea pratensis TaxID=1855912 RepID=A0A143PVH0_LUTPR|nr:DUF2231 domain-containing protein [Luteitalea pratensis]AMY12163.1 putative membrane protein [Luteitalea pratensis]
MTVRAPGARISLICLLVVAALAAAIPAESRPLQATQPLQLIQMARTRQSPALEQPVLRASAPHQARVEAPRSTRARPWWGWILLGRLHPLVVHFPIALLSVTALVELLHIVRRKPVPSEAGTYCLAFGVAGALVAVCLGTLNAANQSVTGEAAVALERHQVMGWISMIAAVSALATGQMARRARQVRTVVVYVVLVLATGAVVSATGHLGAGLVYGDDYLTGVLPWNQRAAAVPATAPDAPLAVPARPSASAPAPASAPVATPAVPATPASPSTGRAARAPRHTAAAVASHEAPAVPESAAPTATATQATDAVDFTRDVMPILKHTCVECHGPEKVKARLRMDSIEGLQKGGKSGPLVKPGDPENSLMMRRVLGLDGDDQMPLDKDPLTEKQIDTLRRWIAAGANYPAASSQ